MAYCQNCADLLRELNRWRELALLRDDLIVCYRVGRRPTNKLLDRLKELREALKADNARPEGLEKGD